jgi:hypothetical protein
MALLLLLLLLEEEEESQNDSQPLSNLSVEIVCLMLLLDCPPLLPTQQLGIAHSSVFLPVWLMQKST